MQCNKPFPKLLAQQKTASRADNKPYRHFVLSKLMQVTAHFYSWLFHTIKKKRARARARVCMLQYLRKRSHWIKFPLTNAVSHLRQPIRRPIGLIHTERIVKRIQPEFATSEFYYICVFRNAPLCHWLTDVCQFTFAYFKMRLCATDWLTFVSSRSEATGLYWLGPGSTIQVPVNQLHGRNWVTFPQQVRSKFS